MAVPAKRCSLWECGLVKNDAGSEWPRSQRSNRGGNYFFFFFAAFFVAKTLTPLRRSFQFVRDGSLHSLDQHVVQRFERVRADFSETLVAL